MNAELDFTTQDLGGCTIARLAGEVDISNAERLQSLLSTTIGQGNVVVDLSKVTFMDSTGLSAMIVAYRRGQDAQHTLRLAGAQGPVRRVLEITQLDIVLEHHDDVGDAVEAALSEFDGTPS
jgi:anti-sigma B factor antagonist